MALKPDLKKKKEKCKLNSSLLANETSTNECYCKALEVGLPLKKASGGLWIDWFCCGRGRCEWGTLKGAYGRGAYVRGARSGGPCGPAARGGGPCGRGAYVWEWKGGFIFLNWVGFL